MSGQVYKCTGIVNEEGQPMDLYIPRKCSVTNKIIHAKDHSSVDENGFKTGSKSTFIVSGYVRAKGHSDASISTLIKGRKPFQILSSPCNQ